MSGTTVVSRLSAILFAHRAWILGLFGVITLIMLVLASQLRIDAGFEKNLPTKHPYMVTFLEYQQQFGGANRVLIAVRAKQGDIFTPAFFETLRDATEAVFFLPGVDRSRVTSIFTPNTRFIEITPEGFAGGNVVPADFQPTPENIAQVRENILKSGEVGRLVSEDFTAAMITAELLDRDPQTGEPLDYIAVSERLESEIRDRFESETIDIHIIGFAKVIGDVAEGALGVVAFFGVAFIITAILVYLYTHSLLLTAMALGCSLVAVAWQLGLLVALGFGIDPMSMLVPFLVFAIAVSHGVQMINGVGAAVFDGQDCRSAAQASFERLAVPGAVALVSDTIGFLTILLIEIPIIQELAITASLGVAVIILTNLILLPVLLSTAKLPADYPDRLRKSAAHRAPLWHLLAKLTRPAPATATLTIAVGLFAVGLVLAGNLAIGDLEEGVPELRPDSRYNQDTAAIVDRFAIGVDLIQVIAEAPEYGCVDYQVMARIDDFEWQARNLPGVQSTVSLAGVMRTINAGWRGGHPEWRVLSRDQRVLAQASRPVETATGLLNADCSAMPILIFTEDHRADTINRVIDYVKDYRATLPADSPVTFRLATGNVGVMAATNEAVSEAQTPILAWVYAAVILLCLITFRSVRGTACVILPLVLVSVLAYALMALLGIGLKVATLPVAALGVGIGVDYGIYIFSRLQEHLRAGLPLEEAYRRTLTQTGSAVLLTGFTLGLSVSSWVFSALQFQADMGILLTFMFVVNMLGAILVLPALASLFNRLRPLR